MLKNEKGKDMEPNPMESRCWFLAEKIGKIPVEELKTHLKTCLSCQGSFDAAYDYYTEFRANSSAPFFRGWDIFNETFALEEIPANISRDDFLLAWNIAVSRKTEESEFRFTRLFKRLIKNGEEGHHAISALLTSQNILLKLIAFDGPLDLRKKYFDRLSYVYRTLREYLGPEDFALLTRLKTEEQLNLILSGWQKAAFGEAPIGSQTFIVTQ